MIRLSDNILIGGLRYSQDLIKIPTSLRKFFSIHDLILSDNFNFSIERILKTLRALCVAGAILKTLRALCVAGAILKTLRALCVAGAILKWKLKCRTEIILCHNLFQVQVSGMPAIKNRSKMR